MNKQDTEAESEFIEGVDGVCALNSDTVYVKEERVYERITPCA